MDPRRIDQESEKVEDLWDELVYSEAVLLPDENAKDLVEPITQLIGRAEQVRLGQLNCWRTETQADALVGGRNYLLDFHTRRFERVLRRELEDRGLENVTERPEYKAYFSIPLGKVLDLALESQIRFMEPWLTHLVRESAPALREFINLFEDQFAAGRSVLKGRMDAEAATRNHRLNEINHLFEDANKERKILAGKLTTRAAERRLPDTWPASFFRRAKRYAKPSPEQLRRDAIFAILAANEITPTNEEKQRIQKERDPNILKYWMNKAHLAKKSDDIFNE